ncbi:MAG: alpha/beta hydrolase [Ignavibacteriae bacterium]|nr:alpha/beta hydrolase [Ignavibacteriota bacterium]
MNCRHHFLSIDNCKIHVEEVGEGKPLLLIHGLGGSLMWQRVVEPLSKNFRVFVIDLPGFGQSEAPMRPFSTENYAECLAQVLDSFSIIKTTVAGISYGGQISATLASRYPERVERLVLVCSTGLGKIPFLFSNDAVWKIFSFIVKQTVLKSKTFLCLLGSLSFYKVSSRPSDLCKNYFQQLSQSGHQDALLNGVKNSFSGGEPFKQTLQKISAPTLILWGENDKTVPSNHAELLHRLIPNSSVEMFSECAHSVPLEKPKEFCYEFLQ